MHPFTLTVLLALPGFSTVGSADSSPVLENSCPNIEIVMIADEALFTVEIDFSSAGWTSFQVIIEDCCCANSVVDPWRPLLVPLQSLVEAPEFPTSWDKSLTTSVWAPAWALVGKSLPDALFVQRESYPALDIHAQAESITMGVRAPGIL